MRHTEDIDGLELISHVPKRPLHPVPLLFVHGAFVAAWCWDDYFLPYFSRQGFAAHALSLRGHGGSAGRDALSTTSIVDYEADVMRIVRHIGEPVVLVGHSLGGMVVQRCLGRIKAAAAVLMASVPPEGLLGSSLLLASRDPTLFGEINRIEYAHTGDIALHSVRRAIFSQVAADEDVNRHLARMQPESQRVIFELTWPQHFLIEHVSDIPILVLGADKDAFFPPSMIESTARMHGATLQIIPDMAHAMMLEANWEAAAERIAEWLVAGGL